ncbi:uncharacterized protein JCM15063_005043 [Sporobolomyces koalae]|uniref:uncharacterized protein n=1 Tax=Sporobolomyces koalae TaxID=500713 RepID=UPI003172C1D7
MSILVLSASDVERVTREISATALCEMVGAAMSVVSTPTVDPMDVQNPQRIATESASHHTLYMPARLTTPSQGPATSVKIVSSPKPGHDGQGLPATTLLLDESTGRVRAIVNASDLTGLRTAAASALASKILANPNSRRLVVFGSGTQAMCHALLILQLFPSIESVQFVVRSRASRSAVLLEASFRSHSEIMRVETSLILTSEGPEAVRHADIICCCVPSTAPLFSTIDLKPGVHINAIGSYKPTMFEFPPALISPDSLGSSERIPTILVDSKEACLHEAGELIASGITADKLIEIGSLCDESGSLRTDHEPTRVALKRLKGSPEAKSLFKCVGVGAMDVAITRAIVEKAVERRYGHEVAF